MGGDLGFECKLTQCADAYLIRTACESAVEYTDLNASTTTEPNALIENIDRKLRHREPRCMKAFLDNHKAPHSMRAFKIGADIPAGPSLPQVDFTMSKSWTCRARAAGQGRCRFLPVATRRQTGWTVFFSAVAGR
jgi:hypothetical protein